MNMYILVEGEKAEPTLYPLWIKYCQPQFRQLRVPEEALPNVDGYYLISGYGFPSVYKHIADSIATINECGGFDFFVVGIDAEDLAYEDRYHEIEEKINLEPLNDNCTPIIMVQNCCLETWLLGNNTIIQNNDQADISAQDYFNWYDVTCKDPESMTSGIDNHTTAQYHEKYLRTVLTACRGRGYQKRRPQSCGTFDYWSSLLHRLNNDPNHLMSFRKFVDFFRNPGAFRRNAI